MAKIRASGRSLIVRELFNLMDWVPALVCRGRIEDGTGGQVYLDFSTRLAVVEFAKSLLAAAYYEESGMREWDPQDGLPKDRVRLTDDSAKLLLFYGHDSPVPSD